MAEKTLNLIMPGNPRYQPRALQQFFGYDYLYTGLAKVEIAGLQVNAELGIIPARDIQQLTPQVIERLIAIPTTEVDRIEFDLTQHDVRAWIRRAQQILAEISIAAESMGKWLHVPFTSYDPLDTGRIIQFVQAHQQALKPAIVEVVVLFAELVRKYAGELQIGRTHGQHALPITIGFWLATILNRIITNAKKMDEFAAQLVGKISGAVGAYNAQVGLGISQRCADRTFEEMLLEKVGLKPATISTQILPPEPLSYFLFSGLMLSAALGQFGLDCRQLMRTEIAEVAEEYEPGQVGSSAMPHKRNPLHFENLEGQWRKSKWEFGKLFETLTSEHQRDLVGSSIMRDLPTTTINLMYQLSTLLRKDKKRQLPFLRRIAFDTKSCRRNFAMKGNVILGEPLYIALLMAGYQGDAHDLANVRAVPLAIERGIQLIDAVYEIGRDEPEVAQALNAIPSEVIELLHHPEQYTGSAEDKAHHIADAAEAFVAAA